MGRSSPRLHLSNARNEDLRAAEVEFKTFRQEGTRDCNQHTSKLEGFRNVRKDRRFGGSTAAAG